MNTSDGTEGRELTAQDDESVALALELARNGEPINWMYWQAVEPTLRQAARLACFFDPIKWPNDEYQQGQIPDSLRQRIDQLEQFIEQHFPMPTISLGHLVRVLGDGASRTLRNAAAPELAALEASKHEAAKQEAARRKAGRYTLEEAADTLAQLSSTAAERWLATIVAAVKSGELPLRNPKNLGDNLPYVVPAILREFYDQVHFSDVNAWLSKHSAWTKARLGQQPEETEPAEPRHDLETSSWKLRICAEATRQWRAWRKAGANPTKYAIRDDLARWCREQGIKSVTGINPSSDYIYKHVLRPWTPPED